MLMVSFFVGKQKELLCFMQGYFQIRLVNLVFYGYLILLY